MGEVVTAFAYSHAPRLWTNPEQAKEAGEGDKVQNCIDALKTQRDQLHEADPDVIIAFLNDHFENFFRESGVPMFCVGIDDRNYGPIDAYGDWLPIEQQHVPNDVDYARDIFEELNESGVNPAYSTELGFGHNLMGGIKDLEIEDTPIVPIMTNTHSPPTPRTEQAYRVGEVVRDVIDRRDEDVAIMATGATSHWPPYWMEHIDDRDYWVEDPSADIDIKDYLDRQRRWVEEGLGYLEEDPEVLPLLGEVEHLQANGHYGFGEGEQQVINEEWDREVMNAFEQGDVEYFKETTYDEIVRRGGDGAYEVVNWIAALGATNGTPAETITYEAVYEFICGMGFITWHNTLQS